MDDKRVQEIYDTLNRLTEKVGEIELSQKAMNGTLSELNREYLSLKRKVEENDNA